MNVDINKHGEISTAFVLLFTCMCLAHTHAHTYRYTHTGARSHAQAEERTHKGFYDRVLPPGCFNLMNQFSFEGHTHTPLYCKIGEMMQLPAVSHVIFPYRCTLSICVPPPSLDRRLKHTNICAHSALNDLLYGELYPLLLLLCSLSSLRLPSTGPS